MRKFFRGMLVFAILISSICIFSGCGNKKEENNGYQEPSKDVYEAPLRNYFEGIKNKDLEQARKARPDFMTSLTQLDIDLMYKQYEEKFGANVKLEYTLGDAVKVTDHVDLEVLANQIRELYPDRGNVDITSAYIIPVTLTVSGDGIEQKAEGEEQGEKEEAKKTDTQDFYVYQYEGNWYMF